MAGIDVKVGQHWFVFGAIIGAVCPILIKLLSKFAIPGISITQATVNINVQTPTTGIYDWLIGIINYSPTIPGTVPILGVPLSAILIGALSLGVTFGVSALIVDAMGFLKGSKMAKVAIVTGVAGIAGALITKTGFPAMLPLAINALLLGLLLAFIDDQAKLNMIPN